jgi:hypothetical protein
MVIGDKIQSQKDLLHMLKSIYHLSFDDFEDLLGYITIHNGDGNYSKNIEQVYRFKLTKNSNKFFGKEVDLHICAIRFTVQFPQLVLPKEIWKVDKMTIFTKPLVCFIDYVGTSEEFEGCGFMNIMFPMFFEEIEKQFGDVHYMLFACGEIRNTPLWVLKKFYEKFGFVSADEYMRKYDRMIKF